MATEKTFLQTADIAVTNARFIVVSQTFAMRNITSVQTVKIAANYTFPVLAIFVGAVIAAVGFAVSDFQWCIFGVLALALGIWFFTKQKPMFAVVLTTASGEVTAYKRYDFNYISRITDALNQSIISHG